MSGATRRVADGVMSTATSAPSARSRRSRSTALNAAIEPARPSATTLSQAPGLAHAGPRRRRPQGAGAPAQGEVRVDRPDLRSYGPRGGCSGRPGSPGTWRGDPRSDRELAPKVAQDPLDHHPVPEHGPHPDRGRRVASERALRGAQLHQGSRAVGTPGPRARARGRARSPRPRSHPANRPHRRSWQSRSRRRPRAGRGDGPRRTHRPAGPARPRRAGRPRWPIGIVSAPATRDGIRRRAAISARTPPGPGRCSRSPPPQPRTGPAHRVGAGLRSGPPARRGPAGTGRRAPRREAGRVAGQAEPDVGVTGIDHEEHAAIIGPVATARRAHRERPREGCRTATGRGCTRRRGLRYDRRVRGPTRDGRSAARRAAHGKAGGAHGASDPGEVLRQQRNGPRRDGHPQPAPAAREADRRATATFAAAT